MYICIYTYMYIYIHIHIYIYINIYLYIFVCVCGCCYVCVCVCTCVYIYICANTLAESLVLKEFCACGGISAQEIFNFMYTCINIHIFIHVYNICIYTYVYTCIYMQTPTCRQPFWSRRGRRIEASVPNK